MSQASSSTELCTVVVCELPATVTSSEIECYFRSSRSGGGDVEEVVFQSSIPGCAHVVFEDEDDAETVAMRQHSIRNVQVKVSLLKPRAKKQQPPPRAVAPPVKAAFARESLAAGPSLPDKEINTNGARNDRSLPSSGCLLSTKDDEPSAFHSLSSYKRVSIERPAPELSGTSAASTAHSRPSKAKATPVRYHEVEQAAELVMPGTSTPTNYKGRHSGTQSSSMKCVQPVGKTNSDPKPADEQSSTKSRCRSPLSKEGLPGKRIFTKQDKAKMSSPETAKCSRLGDRPSLLSRTAVPASTGTNASRLSDGPSLQSSTDLRANDSSLCPMHWQPELSSETRASNEFRSIAGKARPCSEAPLSVGTGAGVEAFQRASPTVVRPSTAADRTQATSTALPGKANRSNVACDALLQRAAINGQLVSVTGDLSSVSLDIVEMYYDSQKSSGGGGVESVHASSSSPTNIHIIFDDFLAAERITARDHSVRGVPLKVTRVLPPDPAACKVFVSNLPDGCSAESLELYFDSVKRSGGGGVQDVAMSSDCLEAVVTFENPDVAAGVACRVHNVRKCPVSTRLVSELSPPTSSILVEEIPLAVGKEELEMYFESKKRSGGSEIADIAYDTEKQVAVVTFTSTYATKRVLDRPHTLRGQPIAVHSYQPSSKLLEESAGDRVGSICFKLNQVILLDIPPGTDVELVRCYIQNAFPKVANIDVELYPENCRALITLSSDIDIPFLERYVARHPLRSRRLKLRRVPRSRVLRVPHTHSTDLSGDTLRLYFKAELNVDVIVEAKASAMEVEFPSTESAEQALSRQHSVSNQVLSLHLVVAGIHYPADDDNHMDFVIHADRGRQVELPVDEHHAVAFRQCPAIRQRLDGALSEVSARLEISVRGSTSLLLIEPAESCDDIARWRENAEAVVRSFMEKIGAMSVPVAPDIFHDILGTDELKNSLLHLLDEVVLIPNLQENAIRLVGLHESVRAAHKSTTSFVSTAHLSLQDQDDVVLRFRPHVMVLFDFAQVVENVPAMFPGVSATCLSAGKEKGCVRLDGPRSQVEAASDFLLGRSDQAIQVPCPELNPRIARLLVSAVGCAYIQSLLDDANLEATTIAASENTTQLSVISVVGWKNDEETLTSLTDTLADLCCTRTLDLKQHETEVTLTSEWSQMLRSASDTHVVSVEVDPANAERLTLSGLLQHVDNVEHLIARFMSENAVMSSSLSVGKCQAKCLSTYMKGKVGEIKARLSLSSVDIRDGSVVMRGKYADVSQGEDEFKRLMTRLCSESMPILKPGIHQFFAKETVRRELRQIEQSSVAVVNVIAVCNLVDTDSSGAPDTTCDIILHGLASSSRLQVCLCKGDITREKSDAIVVGVDNMLSLKKGALLPLISGGLSADCFDEHARHVQQGAPFKPGSVVRMSGLPLFKNLLLAVVSSSSDSDANALQDTVFMALMLADEHRAASVSLPALGAGQLGFKYTESAIALVLAVNAFAAVAKHVQLVKIVLFDKGSVEPFVQVVGGGLDSVFRSGMDDPDDASYVSLAAGAKSFSEPVRVQICSPSRTGIDKAKAAINALCMEQYESKSYDWPSDVSLDEQCRALIDYAHAEHRIHVARGTHGTSSSVTLSGEKLSVMTAYTEIRDAVSRCVELSQREKHAESVAQMAQWLYRGPAEKTWQTYDLLTNCLIEEAFRKFKDHQGPDILSYPNNHQHQVCFTPMQVIQQGRRRVVYDIKRKTNTVTDLPSYWNMSQGLRVKLSPSEEEYQQIAQHVSRTASLRIISIERIQNEALYIQYQTKKLAMDNLKSSTKQSNELRLFHGTDHSTAAKICTQGFDRSFAGKNATRFGRGVYFARDASYSVNYARGSPRQMFQAMVLAGDYTVGSSDMKAPPNRNATERYDSTVDNMHTPGMYITYHDAQAYPEYLITFQ